jgi:hypothetical protein
VPLSCPLLRARSCHRPQLSHGAGAEVEMLGKDDRHLLVGFPAVQSYSLLIAFPVLDARGLSYSLAEDELAENFVLTAHLCPVGQLVRTIGERLSDWMGHQRPTFAHLHH